MDLKSFAKAYQSVQEKKLDPVGKEDGDVDNDGDKDSSDSYLMKRRAAIKKAMKKEEVQQVDEIVGALVKGAKIAAPIVGGALAGGGRLAGGVASGVGNVAGGALAGAGALAGGALSAAGKNGKKTTKEHHQKDAYGNTIPHEEEDEAPGTPSSVEEENDNYVEAYLDELSKKTLGSYIKKATSDRSTDLGNAKNMKHAAKLVKKSENREKGIHTAVDKITKEETVLEQLTENGREIDTFEAVISYLIDEGFAKSWEEAQDIMVTLKPELVEEVYQNQLIESEKLADKAYERAKTLGARRRSSYEYRKKGSFGPGKNERAGYNLSQSQSSRNTSPATQGGPQTGGGPKSFGFARNKSNPVKSKSVGDTGGMGHQKKADTKITTKKDGKTPLKTPRYKYSTKQRDQMGFYGRMEKRDPKKNPKHEANKKK